MKTPYTFLFKDKRAQEIIQRMKEEAAERRMSSILEKIIEPKKQFAAGIRPFDNVALRAMIIPLLIEQLLQVVVGLADTLMVSYAGEATVSGVSLDTMIYTIFIYLFTAVATGGAVVVSQYLGSKERENADLAASQIFHINAALSLICTILMLLLGNAILSGLYGSVEPTVMDACRIYLRIVILSFPANAVYNAGAALYRSMGKTRTTMFVSIAMNLINVAGNAIGVFVLHAGAAGVAWPTTISWYFAAVVMTVLCLNEKNDVCLRVGKALRFHKEMAWRILKIAVPGGIENGLFQLAKVVLGSLIATLGTAQIAANGIGQTIWSFAALVSVAMSPVYITVVGQCMGARDADAADYYMRKLTRLTVLLAVLWNAAVILFLPVILPLYDITAETKRLVFLIVVIHNLFAGIVQPFSMPLAAGLRAAGDVKFAMYSAIFCTVVLRTALSFVLALWLHLGVVGIALAMGIDWTVKAALDLLRYRGGKWRGMKVI